LSRRAYRLGALFRQELAQLMARELKDPRLAQLITITKVEVTSDLQYARVYVSVLAPAEGDKKAALEALQGASTYLRHLLGQRLVIKRVPVLQFYLDDSLERGDRLLRLIDQISRESRS